MRAVLSILSLSSSFLRKLLAVGLLAFFVMPLPAAATATCTAPYNNGPVMTTCEWVFLIYACRSDQFNGGNCSPYAANWVTSKTCYKTWNNQELWDNACNSNTVPASGDNVILDTSSIVTMDANRTVNNFQLNGGCDGRGACQDTYLTLNGYNLTVNGNFTNNSYAEWNCGRYYNGSFPYQTCESGSSSMCEDVCDGHGWTIFNGSAQQTIGGTSDTSFTYLEINNPAGVKLTANVTVTGRLKITSGFIDTNGYSLKVYADCATYPILGSGYVLTSSNGPLVMNFQGGGTETCVFPVADSNGQANVTVTKYGTYKGTLKVSTSTTAPDTQTNMGMDLTNNANHYWTLASGANETYWSYAALSGATWSTTKPGPAAVSTSVTGLSTSATYDVTFQFCATAGTCTLTEKDGAGNGNVTSFIMVQNKTKVAGSGKWTKYASPTDSAAASTTTQTGLTGAFGWFNVGAADPANAYAGIYGGIKLNWKAVGDSACGTACSKTAAASVLWLGHGVGASQPQATHWYGVTTDPGDTWTITGLGSNKYTIASAVNGTCLKRDTVGTYLLMAACNAADTTQQWVITAFSPSGETGGVSLVNVNSGTNAYLTPTAGIQEMNVAALGNNWKGVFFLMPPPPPDHFRFEFDKNGFLNCQPLDITIKACKYTTATEPACTTFYPSSITLTPGATKGTWSGLTAAPADTFTGSDGVTLTDTTAESTTLSYSAASVTPTNATLECYDTSTSAVVSCTQSFAACSNFFDAVEKTTPVSVKGTNLFTKLAGVAFNFDVVGPPTYAGNVTVDLVDASAAAWGCSSGAPTALSTATSPVSFTAPNPATPVVPVTTALTTTLPTIDATTLTRRNSFTAQYDNAAKKVRVRILDALGNCYNSTDYFTIRPTNLSVALTNAGNPLVSGQLANAASPPPTQSTGFTLTATGLTGWSSGAATGNITAGYTGTPTIDWTNAAVKDWNNTALSVVAGAISPSTLVTGGFSAGGGVSAAGTYYYDDFGTLTFANAANIVVDQTFAGPATTDASTSNDRYNGDCDSSAAHGYDNTPTGGKYGCFVGSTVISPLTTNRFRPAYFTASSELGAGCSGVFTYIGQKFGSGALTLTAKSAAGTTLSRLNGSPTNAPAYYVTGYDGTTVLGSLGLGTLPTAAAPASTWTAGSYTVTGTNFATTRPSAPAGPYNAFTLAVTVNDGDSTRITSCTDSSGHPGTITDSSTYSLCQPPTSSGTPLRYGILKMDNAYGSELLPLYVPLTMLHWTGSAWTRNTDDNCTATQLSTTRIAVSQTPTGIAMTAPVASSIISGNPGSVSIKFAATGQGHTGSADVAINLGTGTTATSCATGLTPTSAAADLSWLRGNWCGGSYAKDPSARINFGAAKSPFLYRREKY